jgi:hypothetical protein
MNSRVYLSNAINGNGKRIHKLYAGAWKKFFAKIVRAYQSTKKKKEETYDKWCSHSN